MAEVLRIKVGLPQCIHFADGTIETAIRKQPILEVDVLATGLAGNDVGIKTHHGGVDKAVFFMGVSTFEQLNVLTGGQFSYLGEGVYGENIVLSDWDETNVCVGDRFQIGTAEFEVSQPRRPCSRLSKNTQIVEMKDIIFEHGLTGWYVRIIKTGKIKQGDQVILLDRPYPQWTIANLNRWVADEKQILRTQLEPLLECVLLADAFKLAIEKRLKGESAKVKG